MTTQYLRQCSLVVGNAAGDALDLSDLHIRFRIWQGTTSTPHHATIRVYNLSNDTSYRVQNEFTQLQLQTGYGDDDLTGLFSGTLIQKRDGRENGTDTFLEMLVQDGDAPFNFSVTNATLAAGWTLPGLHSTLLKGLASYGIVEGLTPDFAPTRFPRGKVLYGMTRDHLNLLGDLSGSDWHFSGGKLNLLPRVGYLGDPSKALVLTAETGLIGMPAQTIDGIIVRCLHNANIKVGALLKIDNQSIQRARYSADYQAINEAIPSLANDGLYKVLCVTHEGDTRGQAWYTEVICSAEDGTQPITQRTIAAVP